jgi:hypothetical protein
MGGAVNQYIPSSPCLLLLGYHSSERVGPSHGLLLTGPLAGSRRPRNARRETPMLIGTLVESGSLLLQLLTPFAFKAGES